MIGSFFCCQELGYGFIKIRFYDEYSSPGQVQIISLANYEFFENLQNPND